MSRSSWRRARLAAVAALAWTVAGCAVSPTDYANTTPAFGLSEFFAGPLVADGVFQNRAGKVVSRFRVHMLGTWQGNTGTLVEYFTYREDMPRQARTWTLTEQDAHTFTGTGEGSAGPIVGTARGQAHGYALRWDYRVDLPVGDGSVRVHFDDWMWRLDAGTVINRSRVTKFGVRVGEATLVIRRLLDTPANRALVADYPQFDADG